MTPEDEEQLQHRWEADEAERLFEAEFAAEVEWEKLYGACARRASYRETLGRL